MTAAWEYAGLETRIGSIRSPPGGFGSRCLSSERSGALGRVLCLFVLVLLAMGCDAGQRGPDTARRQELERFYDHLFDEAAGQIGHDLRVGNDELDALGRDRIINAANGLADESAATPKSSYEIELTYLWVVNEGPIAEQGPRHFKLEIDHGRLVELGALPDD